MKKGFAAILATIIILVASAIIILSASFIAFNSLKSVRNSIYSVQAYYAAESGVEDSLLRLSKEMNFLLSNTLTVGSGSATIEISEPIGGAREIIVLGDRINRIRKVRVVYAINSQGVSFHYGVQAGDGGVQMNNNSRIKGNVFSNGNIIGSNQKSYINNSAIVAKNGNKIKDMWIGEDALVYSCETSTIGGNLTYVEGGANTCSVGGTTNTQPSEITSGEMPISQSQIDLWKQEAASGGIIPNDVIYSDTSISLGPIQIGTLNQPRNMTITNNVRFKVTGVIYVTGNIIFSNNVIIELDNSVYGPLSGMIIADGRIIVSNNAILRGSGETGSYILILSTNNSVNPATPAISVNNNAVGAIFYASSGVISLSNNMEAREVTGYKILLSNNSVVEYESGLENAIFSSGPEGSGGVIEWEEIE